MVQFVGTTERQLGFSQKVHELLCAFMINASLIRIMDCVEAALFTYEINKVSVLIQGCFANHEGHSFMVLPNKV